MPRLRVSFGPPSRTTSQGCSPETETSRSVAETCVKEVELLGRSLRR